VYGLHQTHFHWASGQAWEKKCSSSFVLHAFYLTSGWWTRLSLNIYSYIFHFWFLVFGFFNLCDYASARWRSTVSFWTLEASEQFKKSRMKMSMSNEQNAWKKSVLEAPLLLNPIFVSFLFVLNNLKNIWVPT
jgi:hypothetical protein